MEFRRVLFRSLRIAGPSAGSAGARSWRGLPVRPQTVIHGAGRVAQTSVATTGRKVGTLPGARRPQSGLGTHPIGGTMLDLTFVLLAILFFFAGWGLLRRRHND